VVRFKTASKVVARMIAAFQNTYTNQTHTGHGNRILAQFAANSNALLHQNCYCWGNGFRFMLHT
jgi:hypothetical protein